FEIVLAARTWPRCGAADAAHVAVVIDLFQFPLAHAVEALDIEDRRSREQTRLEQKLHLTNAIIGKEGLRECGSKQGVIATARIPKPVQVRMLRGQIGLVNAMHLFRETNDMPAQHDLAWYTRGWGF